MYDLVKKQNGDRVPMGNDFLETKNYVPFINYINIPSMEIKFTGSTTPRTPVLITLIILRPAGLIRKWLSTHKWLSFVEDSFRVC